MPDPARRIPGRSLVTRRAVVEVVRSAILGSYGVTGFGGGPCAGLAGLLGLGAPGIRVRLEPELTIDLRLTVAYGLPIAEVARQVDSAVRYAIRRALGREVDGLAIHVGGLTYRPSAAPPAEPAPHREAETVAAPTPVGRPANGRDDG